MKHLSKIYLTLFFLAVLVLSGTVRASAKALTVGLIGEEPAEDIRKTLPLATYLARQLQKDGFDQGKVFIAKDMNEMASLLREGKVDLDFDNSARALALSRLSGSKPFLRRWKKGIAEYYGVIFVRSDSAINRLEDLQGKTIALEEEFSTVAHLLPKFMFLEKSLRLVPADRVTAGSVGYNFAYWDENTMLWVLKGKVSAGAMDSQTYTHLSKKQGDSLRVLANTPVVPRHVVSVRPGLSQTLLARIKEILMGMDQSDEGKKALQQFDRTSKFDELSEQNTTLIQKLRKLIETELNYQ
jgi:phosphonate transport system substrate-binding protein